MLVGNGSKGVDKGGSKGAVVGNALYGSCIDGINIWEQEIGGDRSNIKSDRGLPP